MAEPPREPENDQPHVEITGGDIEGGIPGLDWHPGRYKEETARFIAYFLVFSLVGSWAMHYAVSAWLLCAGHCDVAKSLSEDFRNWLPVISAAAGGAATYYFTRGK